MRRAAVGLLAAVLAAALPWLSGCGSGLTGGSIPPGGNVSRARGIVVRGDAADQVLAGATLRFIPATSSRDYVVYTGGDTSGGGSNPPSPPDWGGGTNVGGEVPGTVKVTTNNSGSFDQSNLPTGVVTLTVTPPVGSGLATSSYSLQISAGDQYYLLLALPPTGMNTNGLTGIELSPNPISLRVGEATQVNVQLLGGAPPAVVPSYLVKGDVGIVNQQGRFTATTTGTGLLRVQVAGYQKTVSITVRPAQ